MTDSEKLKEELAQAVKYHQNGELTKAETGYLRVLEDEPNQPAAWQLLGVIAHQMGNSDLALERLDKSLAIDPRQPRALNNLGNVHAECGELEKAIGSYQSAVALKSDYAEAYHNLANVLVEKDRLTEAAQNYRQAIEQRPADASSRVGLANVYEKCGRHDEAIEEYRRTIEHQPDSVMAHRRLGNVLRKMGRLAEAQSVYDQWLSFDPDSAIAQHLRAACTEVGNPPARAAEQYVRETFDGFAEDFDECLQKLDYRVPGLIATALMDHVDSKGKKDLAVADIGCGTGLCAGSLRGYARQLTGVDLSPRMLAKAREREVYDELVEGELTEFLAGRSAEFDLIVSADTFIYVGDLSPVFAAAAGSLRAGGTLIFTAEALGDEIAATGYWLGRFGRYVHQENYLRGALEKMELNVQSVKSEILRSEGGEPVKGFVVVASKPDGSG